MSVLFHFVGHKLLQGGCTHFVGEVMVNGSKGGHVHDFFAPEEKLNAFFTIKHLHPIFYKQQELIVLKDLYKEYFPNRYLELDPFINKAYENKAIEVKLTKEIERINRSKVLSELEKEHLLIRALVRRITVANQEELVSSLYNLSSKKEVLNIINEMKSKV